jgi:hypothetical protein
VSVLFAWPEAARVGSRIARDRLFRQAGGGKTIRQLYEEQVERIDWAFKLFDRSVNLRPANGVAEIEVIQVTLRGDGLDDRVLAHIDKALPHPTIMEIVREMSSREEIQLAAAYKRRSEADRSQVVTAEHWRSGWKRATSERKPLPQAVSLDGLYAGLLRNIWPSPARPGESLRQQAERLSAAAMQAKAVRRLEGQVKRERNFARQVELNRDLRAARDKYKELTGGT